MYLEEFRTQNFRNLASQSLKFRNCPVVFFGDNAQGKTNFLEAIYLLSTTKSFRTRSDQQLIAWGQERARIDGKADHLHLEIIITPDKKTLLVNKQNKKTVDLIGSFITVLFSPADIELIGGPPERRRRFLDQLCSNLGAEYLKQLLSFAKIVRHRNQALFNLKVGTKVDLWVWDRQLAKTASSLWNFREQTIKKFQPILDQTGKKLLKSQMNLVYKTLFSGLSGKELEQSYLHRLEKIRDEEIAKTQTLIGPHRDDFRLVLEEESGEKIVSKDLGVYGSRGEQRAAALALKISEVLLLEKESSVRPVLLLDEVLSELDQEHRNLLLSYLKGNQVFITSTSLDSLEKAFGSRLQKFLIREGKAEEINP